MEGIAYEDKPPLGHKGAKHHGALLSTGVYLRAFLSWGQQ